MWIGNVFTVCVSVYLSALVSVSAFVTVWARTFEVVYLENSFFFDFDANLDKCLAKGHIDKHTHTDTHIHTTN